MSDKKTRHSGANKNLKRNLPSWMSSRENESTSHRKRQTDVGLDEERNEGETSSKVIESHGKAHSGSSSSKKNESGRAPSASSLAATNFPKLLEGVVFVLSGFVNPERGVLRSQALEMGAEYQPDWNSDCTLLVCAFPNTPKFRQVEADCGTIVSKEWITECYNQKRLVDIESHLMHAGKPLRRQGVSREGNQDGKPGASMKPQKQAERHPKPNMSPSKTGASGPSKEFFSPSKLKKWALDDLNKTISWLESQEEKPNPTETKKIAAEGILTCLQDAIDSLKQQQDIQGMTEQWMFIPRVVEELVKLEGTGSGSPSLPKEDLYRQAMACKRIYEVEFTNLGDGSLVKNKKTKSNRSVSGAGEIEELDPAAHDSDETIEMTEEEIDQAYNTVTSKLHHV